MTRIIRIVWFHSSSSSSSWVGRFLAFIRHSLKILSVHAETNERITEQRRREKKKSKFTSDYRRKGKESKGEFCIAIAQARSKPSTLIRWFANTLMWNRVEPLLKTHAHTSAQRRRRGRRENNNHNIDIHNSVVIGWKVGRVPIDGDDELRLDERRCNGFDEGVEQLPTVVLVLCTIVEEALRTFDVLSVRVTITGAGDGDVNIEESRDERIVRHRLHSRSSFTWMIGVYCRWIWIEECFLNERRTDSIDCFLQVVFGGREEKCKQITPCHGTPSSTHVLLGWSNGKSFVLRINGSSQEEIFPFLVIFFVR